MSDQISSGRRQFLYTAALGIAATPLILSRPAEAQSNVQPASTGSTSTTFAALKQVNAGALNVGYAEDGSADGPVIILLHGWPYDIHSFVDVAPLLSKVGLSCHRSASARLRHHAFSLRRGGSMNCR